MRVDIHVHLDGPININVAPSDEVPTWAVDILEGLEDIANQLGRVERKEDRVMSKVSDIQTKADATLATVTAETDVVNAVKAVVDHQNADIATIKQQLADAIAGGSADELQKLSDTIDAIQAAETSNGAVVAAAVTAGTPVATDPAAS